MAVMVDFAKLQALSPEGRAEAVADLEPRWCDLEARLVERRRGQAHLMAALPGLTDAEARFTDDMLAMATTHDAATGMMGGMLLHLSELQLRSFTRLAARCPSAIEPPSEQACSDRPRYLS
jgi:hypothetical protein